MASLRNQLLSTYAAEGVNLISGLIFGIMSARALAPEGRGAVAAVWAAVSIGLMITSLGVSKSLVSRLNDNEIEYKSSDYYAGLTILFPILSVTSFIIAITLVPSLPELSRPYVWAIIALAVPIMIANDYARAIHRARRRIYILNGVVAVAAVFRVVTLGILWHYGIVSINSVLIIELSYFIIVFVFVIIALYRMEDFSVSYANTVKAMSSLLSYGVIFQIYSLLFNLVNKLNVIALSYYANAEATGYFAVGSRLAEYLGTFTNQILFVVVPFLAQKQDKGEAFRDSIGFTRKSILFLVPVGLVLIMIAKYFIILLYGKEFEPSIAPFQVMVIGMTFATIFQFTGMSATASGKMRALIISASWGFLVNLIMMYALISEYGALGAAISAMSAHMTSLLIHAILMKKQQGVSLSSIFIPKYSDITYLYNNLSKTRR